ncbi:purine nucleoside permease, partial [Acidithiobacillus caldus]
YMFNRAFIVMAASFLSCLVIGDSCASTASTFSPKVIVLTAFPPEWHAWSRSKVYNFRHIHVAGLIRPLICSKRSVCVMETGEGEINAAISVASIVNDPWLNVKKTIFIRSGIAGGIDSKGSPLGSVYINDWVVSWAFGHHYLSDKKNLAWAPPACNNYSKNFYMPQDCKNYSQDTLENLVYKISPSLVALAKSAIKNVSLKNDSTAILLDRKFKLGLRPKILVGATITGDDFWIGKEDQDIAEKIVQVYTQGAGEYGDTAMEDLGDVAALSRYGLADHYLSIRGISDIDVPPPGYTQERIWKSGDLYAGSLAELNAVIVTKAIIRTLLKRHAS